MPIVTELPARFTIARRIECGGNSQQRKMSWLATLAFLNRSSTGKFREKRRTS
jgi:hypothetical protein